MTEQLWVGKKYPGEGYASIKCGSTEILIGYTLLCHLRIMVEGASPVFGSLCELSNALDLIKSEAKNGNTP